MDMLNPVWDFWSMLAVMGIVQTIIFLVFLFSNKTTHSKSGIFITLILLWITWLQLEFLSVRTRFVVDFSAFYATRHGIWLAFGPLIWHYTKFTIHNSIRFSAKLFIPYMPFLVFTIIIPSVLHESVPFRAVHYGMLTIFKFQKAGEGFTPILYGILYVVQFLHAIVYLFSSYRMLNRYQQQLKEELSSIESIRLAWLKKIIVCLFCVMMMVIIFLILFLYTPWYSRELDYIYILPITVIIYVFSFYAQKEPQLFKPHEIRINAQSKKYRNTGLTTEQVEYHKHRLINHLNTQKTFLDPELRLQVLAEQLKLPPYQLSQIINEAFRKSFFDFINEYRIKEAIQLLQKSSNSNILKIAFACGFNNKVSFNRYFKKYTGTTPTGYQKGKI